MWRLICISCFCSAQAKLGGSLRGSDNELDIVHKVLNSDESIGMRIAMERACADAPREYACQEYFRKNAVKLQNDADALDFATALADMPKSQLSSPSGALPVVASWDFQDTQPGSSGAQAVANGWKDNISGYVLQQHNMSSPVTVVEDGAVEGRRFSLEFGYGQRLFATRESVPSLAKISGAEAHVSLVTWVKLLQPLRGGAFVGGLWEEDTAMRQYAIFMNHIARCPAGDGIVAHISGEGGPSPNQTYCQSRACGATILPVGEWHCIANVYDGDRIYAYVNGTLDSKQHSSGVDPDNPFAYPNPPSFPVGGIYTPPQGKGANFALGANYIHEGGGTGSGELSNSFVGRIGGFVVAKDALAPSDIMQICRGQNLDGPPTESVPTFKFKSSASAVADKIDGIARHG